MPNRKNLTILFLAFFALRLMFGLFRAQFRETDQFQTYLIGLKTYTTGTWPWFGPDVNGMENSFKSQIPGALEGLLIGLPFYLIPFPEAPFILLNLLSLAGVALLTWYIVKRLPGISYIWLFIWIAVAPWSIHESTVMINPAFTFLPSILFFIAFMESLPFFTLNLVPERWANAGMGFSLFWIMQFHFSYVYLVPLALFSLAFQALREKKWMAPVFFALGSLPMLALILPTYLKFGLARGNVAGGFAVPFNWGNVGEFWTILARYLSLVSFEVPRFIGENTKSRLHFLGVEHPFLLVPGLLLWVIGLVQPFFLASVWFRELRLRFQWLFWAVFLGLCLLLAVSNWGDAAKSLSLSVGIMAITLALGFWVGRLNPEKAGPQWKELNLLFSFVFAMVYASFWFTVKMPLSHIYFLFFPLLMTYSCYCWMTFREKKAWRLAAKAFVILGVVFQVGFAIAVEPRDSIYPWWTAIKQAIDQKNYHLMGERRPESLY
ncbi:MAG TPA: hypothetical protein VK859_15155 [bacterium]|nr:hypothetical protein [bacterium]